MQSILRYRKIIGFTILISIFLTGLPQSSVQAVMITTEGRIDQKTGPLSDRARVMAFLNRKEVVAHMQACGISHAEALSRVNSLTDQEIALIAGKLDHIPTGAATVYSADGSFLFFVGVALYAIFMAIILWFSFTDEKEKKPQKRAHGLDKPKTLVIYGRHGEI